jgi:hypothetical protein
MRSRHGLVVVLVALACAAPATGSNVATPRMAAVASWAAGKPISVWCESDRAEWARMLASANLDVADGYTRDAEPVVYLAPQTCTNLGYEDVRLGMGLNVLLHEAAHQRGFHDEALAECAARVLIYSALHDFYGVPWFSLRMHDVVETALAYSFARPAAYQNGCSRL